MGHQKNYRKLAVSIEQPSASDCRLEASNSEPVTGIGASMKVSGLAARAPTKLRRGL